MLKNIGHRGTVQCVFLGGLVLPHSHHLRNLHSLCTLVCVLSASFPTLQPAHVPEKAAQFWDSATHVEDLQEAADFSLSNAGC